MTETHILLWQSIQVGTLLPYCHRSEDGGSSFGFWICSSVLNKSFGDVGKDTWHLTFLSAEEGEKARFLNLIGCMSDWGTEWWGGMFTGGSHGGTNMDLLLPDPAPGSPSPKSQTCVTKVTEAPCWGMVQDDASSTHVLVSFSSKSDQRPLHCWVYCQLQKEESVEEEMYLHSLPGQVLYLFETITLNGCGARVRPYLPVRMGFLESLGKAKVKLCIRLTNIRNSSIFASCSPIHTRFPKNEIRRKSWD